MQGHGFCPQCNKEIPQERYLNGTAICECGWFDKGASMKAQSQAERQTIIAMIGASVFLILLYGHLINWGSYAFSIPVVKLQQITGTLSKDGYKELAEACIRLNKWSCAQESYLDIYKQTNDPEGLAGLAHLQVRLKDHKAAMSSYAAYFKAQGHNGDAALEYAKLLEEAGDTQMAFKYYEASIQMRPQILPVMATTSIVRLLMKQGQYAQAYERILDFHASAGNANGYLNTEMTQLEEYLGAEGRELKRKAAKKVASY